MSRCLFSGLRYGALLLSLSVWVSAASAKETYGCSYDAEDVAPRIKHVLGPRYVAAEDRGALNGSFHELEKLLIEIGHCRAIAQSGEVDDPLREQHVMEWHSLNQWLYRLVNFVGMNANGDASVDWRTEYALFAQVYEFEP